MAVWLIGGIVSVADDSDCEEEHPVVEIDPGAPASERLAQAQENLRNLDLREACEAERLSAQGSARRSLCSCGWPEMSSSA